ncbi:MAG: hypothetical protein AB1490_11795 [Pseudomonadota bacterium]
MIQEGHVLKAISGSGVSKITVIDDAFDPPQVDSDNAGGLLSFLEDASFAEMGEELGIAGRLDGARGAIENSDYGDDDLIELIAAIYDRFVTTGDEKFNPAGMFTPQVANINYVRPILTLLDKCEPKLAITRIGSDPDELSGVDKDTHLIFIDFFLDRGVGTDTGAAEKHAAKMKSLDRVKKLLHSQGDRAASVILMSWQDVEKEADKFRGDIVQDKKSLVFASRFGFIRKTELQLQNGAVSLAETAADTLLDIFQSYEFGRATHAALEAWLESAAQAVGDLRGEIEHLHLKDFAYLLKFRLAQEGQGLLEYLEWFFGECLLDGVGRLVDERVKKDAKKDKIIARLNADGAKRIEGAFDGPTKKVAELYHRVRIENPRGKRTQYRMGDLYLSDKGKEVLAIITPECDLITRSDGKRTAPRILTRSGKIKKFDAPDASVADFILLDGKPHNIAWSKTGVATKEFKDWPKPGAQSKNNVYVGTLRPLYAQELQRSILNDLGRVGLFVAPALGMTARAKIFLKQARGAPVEHTLAGDNAANCYVVPSRGGTDKPLVLFKRGFVSHLIESLAGLDKTGLANGAEKQIEHLKKDSAYGKLQKMVSGIGFEEPIDLGIYLTGKPSPKGDEGSWCIIKVEMVEES